MRSVGGTPLVVRALRALGGGGLVDVGVVVVPAESCGPVGGLLAAEGLAGRWGVVVGGATRAESVACGLAALPVDVDIVLVHDAARAFVPPEVVERVLAAVEAGADAAVPVVPLADTVKLVDAEGNVRATPERASLRQVQTPQAFRRDVLAAAYAAAPPRELVLTDDAGLVEHRGGRVVVVDGDPLAFKVTGPLDLLLAEAVAGQQDRQDRQGSAGHD